MTVLVCTVQVTLLHLSRVALPGYWPLLWIPRGQGGSLDWLGEEIGVAQPSLYSIFQEMVLEGPVLLPQYVTVERGDGSKVALGPSLTQPCTTYRFERIEVRTSSQGRVYAVATQEEEEKEEFHQILVERRAKHLSEEEERQEDEEEKKLEDEEDEEEDEDRNKDEKEEGPKEEKKDGKKEEKKEEDSKDSGGEEAGPGKRRRMVKQRRSGN